MNDPEFPDDWHKALAYQAAKDFPDAEVQDGEYRCAMCGGVFQFIEGADEKARAEAEQNGIDLAECVIVCDDCYKRTVWI